jgi:outer membrane biosynthesis protein TonB
MANTLTDYLSRRGLAVRSSDVVSMLQSLFPGAREESRRRVDAWMQGQQASTPFLYGLTEGGSRAPTSTAPKAPDRPFWRFVAASVVIVAVLVGGWFLLGWRPGAPATAAQSPSAVASSSEDPVGTESFHLALNSNPVQCDIEWNGGPLGQTPLMLDLDPGSHVFVLQHEGFHPATLVVTVTAHMGGKTESRIVTMVPISKDEKGAARNSWAQPQAKAAWAGPSPGGALAQGSLEHPASAEAASSASPASAPAATTASALATALAPAPSAAAPDVPATGATAPSPTTASAVAPPAAAVLAFGPDMSQPKLLSSVDPVFPREAIVAKVEGTVIAKCTITTSGSLEGCRIIKGLPFMDKPMLDALAKRKYTPVIYRGSPVAVQYVFSTHIVRP